MFSRNTFHVQEKLSRFCCVLFCVLFLFFFFLLLFCFVGYLFIWPKEISNETPRKDVLLVIFSFI